MMRLKDITNGEMNIINGPDELLAMGLVAGADAGIGSTYNVMLPEFIEIYNAVKSGDVAKAHEIQKKVNRVINVIIKYEVLPGVKHACEMIGFPVGEATFPMKHYSDEQKKAFESELKAVGFPFAH